MRLDLQPFARPLALAVRGIGALGEDALQALFLRRLVERLAVLEGLREPDGAIAPVEQGLELLAALDQRELDERPALQLEQVEHLVDDRRPGLSLLHRREARAALVVECANLSVEDAVGGLHRLRHLLGDGGEPLHLVVASPAVEPLGLAPAHVRDRAVSVPLDLEEPAVRRRKLLTARERRQHRLVALVSRRRRGSVRVALAEDQPVLRRGAAR